jgi:peptidoglycan/LPS O-acetylase OafA/YrhL
MTASTNRPYLPEVDQLRALAAILVLLFHGYSIIGTQLALGRTADMMTRLPSTANPLIVILEEGHSGVALFIVLSGFILARGAIGNGIRFGPFLTARALRIYPMMLLCLLAAISAHTVSAAAVIEFLLPVNAHNGEYAGNLTGMFWAVKVELQCYLLFPFLIAFSNARGSRFLLQLVAVVVLMRCLVVFADGADAYTVGYWTIAGRLDQFCIGIAAARLFPPDRIERRGVVWLLLAVGFAMLALNLYSRLHLQDRQGPSLIWPTVEGAMWAAVIVTYIAAGRRVVPRVFARALTRFGEASYSFYLLHFAVVFAVVREGLFVRLTGDGYDDAIVTTLLVVLPVTGALAALTYATVERPFLGLRPKYIVRQAAARRSDVIAL